MSKSRRSEESLVYPAGSIEQQLDMCEDGPLRGDEVLRENRDHPNFHVDLSDGAREGDEMSGDDHSSGMQGEDSEHPVQEHIPSGLPGDETRLEELRARRRQ